MPTIPIDLSDDQHAALSIIAGARGRPRAEIIGDAIDAVSRDTDTHLSTMGSVYGRGARLPARRTCARNGEGMYNLCPARIAFGPRQSRAGSR